MKNLFRLVAASLSAAILTACGGDGDLASRSPLPSQHQAPIAPKQGGPTLYVLNSGGGHAFGITIYSDGGASFLRGISIGQYSDGFTVDTIGRLYFGYPAQSDPSVGQLSIYENRGAKLLRMLHQTHPFAQLVVDRSGNLFTNCAADRICEYAGAKQHVSRRIALRPLGGADTALAVDSTGDLAAGAFYGPILVFAPGATTPYWKITNGIDALTSLAFDPSGNLYVANSGANEGDPGSVTVYPPGKATPSLVITDGIVKPFALALDASSNLYVLNYCDFGPSGCEQLPAVTEYPFGGNTPNRTITDGVGGGYSLQVDRSGNIYVANAGNSNVSPPKPGNIEVYAPGNNSPMRTVTKNIDDPLSIGISPQP